MALSDSAIVARFQKNNVNT